MHFFPPRGQRGCSFSKRAVERSIVSRNASRHLPASGGKSWAAQAHVGREPWFSAQSGDSLGKRALVFRTPRNFWVPSRWGEDIFVNLLVFVRDLTN